MNWSLLENKWVEVISNANAFERLGPGVPITPLGKMLKAGCPTELAFTLQTALNISCDEETGATSFNQPLNNWNVSNVTTMGLRFQDATSFNQPLNNWNVSNVTDMMLMFTRARSFNRPLNNWNVSKVETMFAMFDDATSLNQPLHAPWYHEESEDKSDTDSDSE